MNSGYNARLALPMGTMEIIPGFSGAGERIPAPAQDASRPGSCASKRATRKSLRVSSRAMAPPIRPPPAMIASYDLIPAFYLGGRFRALFLRGWRIWGSVLALGETKL